MGVATVMLSDLRIHGWGLTHDTPRRFVEPMIGRSAGWYSVYRTFAAMFVALVLVVAIAQMHGNRDVLHFPIWGYTVSMVNSVLFAACVINHRRTHQNLSKVVPTDTKTRSTWSEVRRLKRSKYSSKSENVTSFPLTLKVVWVTHYISVYSAFTSIIFEASNLFKGEENLFRRNSWLIDIDEAVIHAVFAAYVFLDFWLIGLPVRLLHFYIMLLYAIVYNVTLLIATVVEGSMEESGRAVVQYDVADFNSVKRTATSAMFFFCFALLFPITIHLVFYVLYVTKLYVYDTIAAYMRGRKADLTATTAAAAAAAAVQPDDVKVEKEEGLESPAVDSETTVRVQENVLDTEERRRSGTSGTSADTRTTGKGPDHRRTTITSVAEEDAPNFPGPSRRQSRASSGDLKAGLGGAGHRTSRSGSMMESSRAFAEQLGITATPLFEDDFTVLIDPE